MLLTNLFFIIYFATDKITGCASHYQAHHAPKQRTLCRKINNSQPDNSAYDSEYAGCFTCSGVYGSFAFVFKLTKVFFVFFAMV